MSADGIETLAVLVGLPFGWVLIWAFARLVGKWTR